MSVPQALIDAVYQGNADAENELSRHMVSIVKPIALSMLKDQERALDVIQTVSMEIIMNIRKKVKYDSFEAWVKTTTRRRTIDLIRTTDRDKSKVHSEMSKNNDDNSTSVLENIPANQADPRNFAERNEIHKICLSILQKVQNMVGDFKWSLWFLRRINKCSLKETNIICSTRWHSIDDATISNHCKQVDKIIEDQFNVLVEQEKLPSEYLRSFFLNLKELTS